MWTTVHSIHLKCVVTFRPPFVIKFEDNGYEGFALDLIHALSRVVPFNYTVYLTPNERYDRIDDDNDHPAIVRELSSKRADIAILVKHQWDGQFIDFSEPYMTAHLSALIHKRYIANMTSFADILDNVRYSPGWGQLSVEKVLNTNYALIEDSVFNEYAMDRNCELTVIDHKQEYNPIEYVIGLQRDCRLTRSPYKADIDRATGSSNQFEGYAIDLLNELSRVVPFNYTLYPDPDGNSGRSSGMIQELFMRRADFAIADLMKTRTRERYIDFSEPFMRGHLTALIHRRNVRNMTTFSDLVNNTDVTCGLEESLGFIRTAIDPIIWSMVQHNGSALVNSEQEGVDRALSSSYAFIQASAANEYQMGSNCHLTVIHHKQEYYPIEYAIGLQKGSPYKMDIDRAIRQLRNDGTVDRLKRKYWRTKCLKDSDVVSVAVKL
ncbi:unnamed protein product, partial [Oppiella nova]